MLFAMRRPRDVRASHGYDRWERGAERPMLGLSVAFLVVLVLPLVLDLPHWGARTLLVANVLLWVAFTIDYVARLYLAPERWRFVRSHPLDLLVVLVPFLRPLRVARLLPLARLGAVTACSKAAPSGRYTPPSPCMWRRQRSAC